MILSLVLQTFSMRFQITTSLITGAIILYKTDSATILKKKFRFSPFFLFLNWFTPFIT